MVANQAEPSYPTGFTTIQLLRGTPAFASKFSLDRRGTLNRDVSLPVEHDSRISVFRQRSNGYASTEKLDLGLLAFGSNRGV